MYCQDSFNIVPVQNLITNIGIAKESTHSTSDIRNLPHGIRSVFNMKRFDNEQNEFVGPSEITEEVEYRTKVCRLMGWGHPLVNIWRKIESVMLVTYYSGIKTTIKKIRKHIGR